jgi:P-type E1-E2 ATPase
VLIGSLNNYSKEKQFQKLMAVREERDVVVIRDEKDTSISVHKLLVGDILKISSGDQIPADCILISGNKVTIDESSQTGETMEVDKHPLTMDAQNPDNPFLISGTLVKEGSGYAVVVCVGRNTRMGRIRETLEEEEDLTPLQRKLESIADGNQNLIILIRYWDDGSYSCNFYRSYNGNMASC